jgi:hypothetical protein
MIQPQEQELFYFGLALTRFAPHKAARILGLRKLSDQDGREKPVFVLEYGDGEKHFADFSEESQGSFELLTEEEGVKKYGENVFT